MEERYAIEMRGICKNFGSVAANKNINLNVRPGEILALLGENGSGKTTLMNMLSGIYKPDSGSILVDGQEAAMPPLPGRAKIRSTLGSSFNFWIMACSRPPPPITRIFIVFRSFSSRRPGAGSVWDPVFITWGCRMGEVFSRQARVFSAGIHIVQ